MTKAEITACVPISAREKRKQPLTAYRGALARTRANGGTTREEVGRLSWRPLAVGAALVSATPIAVDRRSALRFFARILTCRMTIRPALAPGQSASPAPGTDLVCPLTRRRH
jgi:hypothetical protein